MDWMHFLFNTDHTFSWQEGVMLIGILIAFNVWKSWYENRRRREEAMRYRQSNIDPEHPVWHAPKKKKRSKK